MRILKIWDADYPWDIRVEKLCTSLAKSGHEIHILARNLEKKNTFEQTYHFTIHRLPYINSRLNEYISFPAFFNPLWLFNITRLIKKLDIELIIVRDLPLALSAIYAGKRHNIPVILDMAENYPFLINDIWKFEPLRIQNYLLRNRLFTRLIEKLTFKYIDHVITVVDESRSRVLNCSHLNNNQVSIVNNTPNLNNIDKHVEISGEDLELFKKSFVAIYVGGVRLGRGLEQVFEAIPLIIKEIENFLFVIVGTGKDIEILHKKSEVLGIRDHVYFKGWTPFDNVPSIIRVADVGIIPHYVTDHTNHTVPNKLFDFMGLELPVIASEAIPMKRILSQEKCGLTFSNSDNLAIAILKLRSDNLRSSMGRNGRNAVEKHYNWQVDASILNGVIKQFKPDTNSIP